MDRNYATIMGVETIKSTQSRLLGIKIAQFQSGAPKLACYRHKKLGQLLTLTLLLPTAV